MFSVGQSSLLCASFAQGRCIVYVCVHTDPHGRRTQVAEFELDMPGSSCEGCVPAGMRGIECWSDQMYLISLFFSLPPHIACFGFERYLLGYAVTRGCTSNFTFPEVARSVAGRPELTWGRTPKYPKCVHQEERIFLCRLISGHTGEA